MKFEIEPLAAPLGAVIRGWEPAKSLDGADRKSIIQALRDHLVLVFRGQRPVTDDELIRFAGSFGDLIKGSTFLESTRDRPEILLVGNLVGEDGKPEGVGGSMPFAWHADYSYCERVGKESFLNAVELPKTPPHTYFCDQYRAWATLPEAMKERLRDMRIHHSITSGYGDVDSDRIKADRERDRKRGVESAPIPEAEHPLVVRHPDSGREILYLGGPQIKCSIIGIESEESDALLARLCEHSTRSENVIAHDWEIGDLVMFDTLGTMHKRDSWDSGERRHMRQLSTISRID